MRTLKRFQCLLSIHMLTFIIIFCMYYTFFPKINKVKYNYGIKYILLWTQDDFSPFYYMGNGQQRFIANKCLNINCYVTSDRTLFGGDVTKFDAIAFNGRSMKEYNKEELPKSRSLHQKYIFFNMESSDNEPICYDFFNNVFNWTSSYKLKSDIPFTYILIRHKNGTIAGPKQNMKWVETMEEVNSNSLKRTLQEKNKVAAWFVSNCKSRSKREEFVEKLQNALKRYRLKLDIYGNCGKLTCPQSNQHACNVMLEKNYYFYLSLENSFAEDYVTEKLLYALQHNVVPIVYGGADYTRFLPPKSYLNGLKYSPEKLAKVMITLILSPKLYEQYFKWKKYYSYEDAMTQNVCNLCETLNNRRMVETTSIYPDLKKWWNEQEYPQQCGK